MIGMEREIDEWQSEVSAGVSDVRDLLDVHADARTAGGYGHTIREILQQPVTWKETAIRAAALAPVLGAFVHGGGMEDAARSVMLTGSGSSLYAGECVAPALQRELGVPVRAIAGGDLLTHPQASTLPGTPRLLVSLARSGDSPESAAVVEHFLERDPYCRHILITCNERGLLATAYPGDARVQVLLLDDPTNDRSLVMTSSFTNMALAARILGMTGRPEAYAEKVELLCGISRGMMLRHTSTLAGIARDDFRYVVYLGAGCCLGAAREASLKMMEMSAGRVRTMSETYLGLRHGPMACIHEDTIIVCFLSADPLARAYEFDLIRELGRKKLGRRKVIVGEEIAPELLGGDDVAVECPGLNGAGDDGAAIIAVLAGQLLAFFRCRSLGMQPDFPSPGGVISRVVASFLVHKASDFAP